MSKKEITVISRGGSNVTVTQKKPKEKIDSNVSSNDVRQGFNVLSLVLGLVLVVSLFKTLLGNGFITFGGLLSSVADAPSVSMSMTWFDSLEIVSDWGAFNFIRDFFNMATGFYSVIEFCARGLLQVIIYVIWVAKFIFF